MWANQGEDKPTKLWAYKLSIEVILEHTKEINQVRYYEKGVEDHGEVVKGLNSVIVV